jgi:hypothetical protein
VSVPPKFFTSDWFIQITILVTYVAIVVPLAFLGEHGGRTILRPGDGKGLPSASATDLPDEKGYDIFIEPFCIFVTSHQTNPRAEYSLFRPRGG